MPTGEGGSFVGRLLQCVWFIRKSDSPNDLRSQASGIFSFCHMKSQWNACSYVAENKYHEKYITGVQSTSGVRLRPTTKKDGSPRTLHIHGHYLTLALALGLGMRRVQVGTPRENVAFIVSPDVSPPFLSRHRVRPG